MFIVGNTTVQKVYEFTLRDFALNQLLPALDEEVVANHPEWIPAGTVEDESGRSIRCTLFALTFR